MTIHTCASKGGRLFALAALVLIVGVNANAGRKSSSQSGIVSNGVFIDSLNKYSVPVSDDWKMRLGSAEDDSRLSLIHKHPAKEKPRRGLSGLEGLASPAKVQFLMVRSHGNAKDVVDSVAVESSSWDLRKKLWADLEPQFSGHWNVSKVVTVTRKTGAIGGRNAVQWRGKLSYSMAGESGVLDMGLFLTAVDMPNGVLLIAESSEESVMDWLSGETGKLLDSLKCLPKSEF